jgi:hypothetical protein
MSRTGPTSRLLQAAAAGLLGLFVVAATHSPTPVHAQSYDRDPAFQEFYETLDEHGEWVSHPRYGETWVPYANEDPGWRPYSRGQWAYTEEHGWLWDSEEDFGWIVYHYGRWLLDRSRGWMWVPGTEWGPAWVAWRESDDAIGWAPLPPEADFDSSGELVFDTFGSHRNASMWMFVAPAMLTMPAIYRHFYPRSRSSFYFGRSRSATFYGYRGRSVFNRGIDRRFIEQRARRPVPVIQIRPVQRPRDIERRRPGDDRRPIGIYRPNLPPPGSPRPFRRDGGDWRAPTGPGEARPGPGAMPHPGLPPNRGELDGPPRRPFPAGTQPGFGRPLEGQPRRPPDDGNWRPAPRVPVSPPPSGVPSTGPGGPRIDGPIMRPSPSFPPREGTPRREGPIMQPPAMPPPRSGPSDDRRLRYDGGPRQSQPGFTPPPQPPPPRPQMQATPPQPRATPPQAPQQDTQPRMRPPTRDSLDDPRPRGGPRQ